MEIIVKTPLDLEKVAAERIRELDPGARLSVKPHGFKGLVIVESCGDRDRLVEEILEKVPEAETVVPVEAESRAVIEEIRERAVELARRRIGGEESFAVRTVRRGSHGFRSMDVNVAVGSAVQEATGAQVNLDNPDKILQVEIVMDRVGLAVLDGSQEWRKMAPGKRPSTRFFRRVSVIQMPYLGTHEGAREIGARIGRAVQAYEVRELVIAPHKPVDAFLLSSFIEGVGEGVESRYQIQLRSYGREVKRVQVLVHDLYQLVRERRGEVMVVFEPEGLQLRDASKKLRELMARKTRINFLFGSREGIPKGVYRMADLVIDLAPGITLPTELAAPSGLTAVYTALNMMDAD